MELKDSFFVDRGGDEDARIDAQKYLALEKIMRCPKTSLPLEYNETVNTVFFKTKDGTISYSIKDEIIDFVGETINSKIKNGIEKAYDKSIFMYDDYMVGRKLHWRLLKQILLGFSKEEMNACNELAERLIKNISHDFVLEVPVGTGIFTIDVYKKFPHITFIAIDYARSMLLEAKKKIDFYGLKNVILIRADAANLPFKDRVFGGLITLNGIHAFPEKHQAIKEMERVAKVGARIHGSLVIKNARKLTDLMIYLFYLPGKWFFSPVFTKEEFILALESKRIKTHQINSHKALMLFEASVSGH